MKKCPFCAEEIQEEAIECKHCGSLLDGREEEKEDEFTKMARRDWANQKTKGVYLDKDLKTCPSCGGYVARFAYTCPHCGKQFTRPVTMGCAVIVVFIFLAIICTAICEQVQSPSNTSKSLSSDNYSGAVVGKESTLTNTIFAAVTKDYWDEMGDYMVAEDNIGVSNMLLQGKIFKVESSTRVRIIDTGFTTVRIRILDGENAGLSGWIPREFVR